MTIQIDFSAAPTKEPSVPQVTVYSSPECSQMSPQHPQRRLSHLPQLKGQTLSVAPAIPDILMSTTLSEDSETAGDEKDEEIARLKRAYHDAVLENSNKKASAKTNT